MSSLPQPDVEYPRPAFVRPPVAYLWTLRTLSLIAFCVSGYLAWIALTEKAVYGCGGESSVFDCGHVMTSHWAKVAGVPVSVPAFALYSIMLSALAFCHRTQVDRIRQACWSFITAGGIAAGLAALWFAGLQVFVLDHICPWCMAAHTCGILIAGLLIWKQPSGRWNTARLSSLSVAATALLITTQYLSPEEQKFQEITFDDVSPGAGPIEEVTSGIDSPSAVDNENGELFAPPGESNSSSATDDIFEPPGSATSVDVPKSNGETVPDAASAASLLMLLPGSVQTLNHLLPAAALLLVSEDESEASEEHSAQKPEVPDEEPERRLVGVTGNKFRLDVRQWPLLGKPDAKYVFVEMYDYTCPHCRSTHQAVKGAFDRYGDDLAVVALPVPLDRACNSSASTQGGQHRDACEIARIAVAVWRVEPEKFKELHNWLFEANRTAFDARRQAETLVGKEALDKELGNSTAQEYIARHVDLYKRVGAGSVPKLMFPNTSLVGEMNSTQRLCETIERELASQ